MEFHPTGTCIGVALSNGVVKIYETRMKKVLQLYEIHNGPVRCLSFHPSGNYLISGSDDGTLKVLDLLEGRPSYTLYGSKGAVHTVKFSPSGEHFATGTFPRTLVNHYGEWICSFFLNAVYRRSG